MRRGGLTGDCTCWEAERRISPTVTVPPLRSVGLGTTVGVVVTGTALGTTVGVGVTGTGLGTTVGVVVTGTALGTAGTAEAPTPTECRLSSDDARTPHPLGRTSDTRYPRDGLAVGDAAVGAPRPGRLRQSRVLDFSSCALSFTPLTTATRPRPSSRCLLRFIPPHSPHAPSPAP